MKILERGKPPGDIEVITVCRNCNSKLQFAVSEVVTVRHWKGSFYEFNCPVCEQRITHSIDR